MKFNAFLKSVFLVVTILFIASCDKDFNEIGADLIDDVNYNFERETASVLAYNVPVGPVQTSNLPINTLGFYSNGIFGSTTSSFVTQLELETVDPKFYGEEDLTQFKIDSVYLYVPYFSKLLSTDSTTGDSTYQLDSIQGGTEKIKLGVFESKYFLRNLDPASSLQEEQRYYSNESFLVESVSDVSDFDNRLNKVTGQPHPDQDAEFVFKNTEIKLLKNNETGTGTVKERLAPGIYMDLNKEFFMNKIVNAPAGSLTNNTVFKNYFKGIYFKAQPLNGSATQGTAARLDFSKGKIIMVYRGKDSDAATSPYIRKTLTINMSGKTVNFFETNYTNPITPNPSSGDEKLHLRGGVGSMTVLKLFTAEELQNIKSKRWLINEASLVFHIDQQSMSSIAEEPNRVYLFDLDNKRPLVDYGFDNTSNALYPKFDKVIHGGIIEIDQANNRGVRYKVRITNHIRNIISKDSTNVSLGLVVTESIGNRDNVKLKNSFTAFGKEIKFIPAMSVANPLGTILWGNTSSVPQDKKLTFEIYYTKPD